jgi:hypothetical protein
MPKPIFIIGLPGTVPIEGKTLSKLKKDFNDYHVLVYIGSNLEEPKFQVFYDKYIEEKKIEEIQQMIMGEIKK